ncbi:5606_t:CDS:2 [Paraglomus occultum]|uniref:5606_t:CDS:1 n=1 Tax=Paraglomus occultum TaxID=144539 RepID=A0A9N9FW74_9GLOM|nr:5606_t:CDS:2 [Paraglomus occultum]
MSSEWQPLVFRVISPVEPNSPSWPSLYWPLSESKVNIRYPDDMIRFTLYWTIIFFEVIYGVAGLWALAVSWRYKWSYVIPVAFVVTALLTGSLSGSIVGGVLAALYGTGQFPMSTCKGRNQSILVLNARRHGLKDNERRPHSTARIVTRLRNVKGDIKGGLSGLVR